jgi:hypothetical protein
MAAAVTRTVPNAATLLRRARVALQCRYARFRIRAAEKDLAGFKHDEAHLKADLAALPAKEASTRAWIEARRVELASQEASL